MERAVTRLDEAIRAHERICVWGDFDVDGQTSTTVLVATLRDLGAVTMSFVGLTFAAPTESGSAGEILRVGPQRTIQTIKEAAKQVPDGGIIEVDAGEYLGDVVVWSNKNVTLRAVGGRVRLSTPPALPPKTRGFG